MTTPLIRCHYEGKNYIKLPDFRLYKQLGNGDELFFRINANKVVEVSEEMISNMSKNFMEWEDDTPVSIFYYHQVTTAYVWKKIDATKTDFPDSFASTIEAEDWAKDAGFTTTDEDGDLLFAPFFRQAYDVIAVEEQGIYEKEFEVHDIGEYHPCPPVDYSWEMIPGPKGWGATEEFFHYNPCRTSTGKFLKMFYDDLQELKRTSDINIKSLYFFEKDGLSIYYKNGEHVEIRPKLITGSDIWDLQLKVEAWKTKTWKTLLDKAVMSKCDHCGGSGWINEDATTGKQQSYEMAMNTLYEIAQMAGRSRAKGLANRTITQIKKLRVLE